MFVNFTFCSNCSNRLLRSKKFSSTKLNLTIGIYMNPIWSSGQDSCLSRRRPGFDSRCGKIFFELTTLIFFLNFVKISKFSRYRMYLGIEIAWVCGAMDNASDYESGDCRFDPYQTRYFLMIFITLKKLIKKAPPGIEPGIPCLQDRCFSH